ncbi:MAG: hypothetical protein QOD84_1733 [Acidobacteriaceae bacterium]
MRPALFFAAVAFLIPRAEAQGQSVPTSPAAQSGAAVAPSTSGHGYRPKISLQTALTIAENYLATEHVDVSDGWLLEARFSLYGDKGKDKDPCWLFDWNMDHGVHVEVIVFMDGKAMLSPSM